MSRYTERVAQQRCGRCGKQDDNTLSGFTLCYECREKRRAANLECYYRYHEERKKAMRDRIEWLKSRGICVACGQEKAREGFVLCEKCATKRNECKRKKRSEENG